MPRQSHRKGVETSTYWFIGSAISFTIGIVAALGEWVFHWWNDPGQWLAVIGLGVGFVQLGFGANARQLRKLHRDQGHGFQDLKEGQERLVRGQDRLVQGQDRLVEGQREQTGLLRQLVDSFRGRIQE